MESQHDERDGDEQRLMLDLVTFLDDVSQIHEVDEYVGECHDGCLACVAERLLARVDVALLGPHDAEGGDKMFCMAAIAMRLRTQDNQATASPIYVVQQRKRTYGLDPDWTDNTVWIDGDAGGDDCVVDDELAQKLDDGHEVPGDAYYRTGYVDEWVFVNSFMTNEAAKRYIEENSHNLKDPRVFIDSGYRNKEWEAIRRHIMETY